MARLCPYNLKFLFDVNNFFYILFRKKGVDFMQQVTLGRQQNREFQEPVPHRGYTATIFGIVTAVAKPFQMIGSYFVGTAFWLKDRVTDSSSYFWRMRDEIAFASRLVTQDMGISGMVRILKAVRDISDEEREEVVSNAFLLIREEMEEDERLKLIKVVASIPRNERGPVTAFSLGFTDKKVLPFQRVEIVEAVRDVPAEEREEVVNNAHVLITKDIEMGFGDLIRAVASIPRNERGSVTAFSLKFIDQNMCSSEKVWIVEAVRDVSAKEREEVVNSIPLLFTKNMMGGAKGAVIRAVASMPGNEKNDFVVSASRVVNEQMRGHEKEGIILAVRDVPSQERKDVIDHTVQAIHDPLKIHDTIRIIQSMARVPAHERPNLVQEFRRERRGGVSAETSIKASAITRQQRLRKRHRQISKDIPK